MTIFLISLLILGLRVLEVGLGTIRIVMLVRERSLVVGVLGFVQSLIWVSAAGIVLTNLDSPVRIIAFSLGFGVGTALGSVIEQKLALGNSILRIVTPTGSPSVEDALRGAGYGVTVLNARSSVGTSGSPGPSSPAGRPEMSCDESRTPTPRLSSLCNLYRRSTLPTVVAGFVREDNVVRRWLRHDACSPRSDEHRPITNQERHRRHYDESSDEAQGRIVGRLEQKP